MVTYFITLCALISGVLTWQHAPGDVKIVVCPVIAALWIGFVCTMSLMNFYSRDRTNDDIYDKDFTSLDDVPKPVVKIDEHC